MRAKEVRELVKIVEESNIGELEITKWGQKIRISKSTSSPVSTAGSSSTEEIIAVPPQHQAVVPEAQSETVPAGEKTPASDPGKSTLVEIKSPMVGTFYRSPSPDTDSYVQEGDSISSGKVLCIIEAMKLMNEIEAEVSGKIVQILIENAQAVEYDQPLFLIEPAL